MKLYLARHGHAVSKEEDPERPLSDHGRQQVARVAAALQRAGVTPQRIYHSGKRRAEQTAAILGATLAPGVEPMVLDGLAPMDPVKAIAKQADKWQEATLLAGHLPSLGLLASRLLGGKHGDIDIDLETAAVIALERNEQGWQLKWLLGPSLLPE